MSGSSVVLQGVNRPPARQLKSLVLLVLLPVVLMGCATYGKDIQSLRQEVATQQWQAAEQHLDKAIAPQGPDGLLYYLESGMLKHLQGDYAGSNARLETAYGIMDPLYRTPVMDQLKAVVSSPRHNPYRGDDFEQAMVSFVKILNDLNLASQSSQASERRQHLEAARVESRRIRLALERTEAAQEAQVTPDNAVAVLVADLMAVDDLPPVPPSALPLLDWMTALVYEMLGETDSARIALQQALTGYGLGYDHSFVPVNTAAPWLQQPGGSGASGEVVIMQLAGLVPEQREMNIFVGFQGVSQTFTYRPQVTDGQQGFEQQLWFNSTVGGPKKRGYWARSAAGAAHAKDYRKSSVTLTYQPSNPVTTGSLLQRAIINGFRVPIAYYSSSDYSIDSMTQVRWSTGTAPLPLGLSVGRKAMADHADHAIRDFYLAFARELAQQMLAEAVYQGTQGDNASDGARLLGSLTQLTASLGAQADTRSWLTLPKEVNMVRLRLPVGEHRLEIVTQQRGGRLTTQPLWVEVKPQQLQFYSLYTP